MHEEYRLTLGPGLQNFFTVVINSVTGLAIRLITVSPMCLQARLEPARVDLHMTVLQILD